MFWKKTSFEIEHLSQPVIIKVDIRKKNLLNLTLTNSELFIIYWTCYHLFWFLFLRARLHDNRSEIKPVWNLRPLWNVVPFTWQFTWKFHCGNFPNNSKTLLHMCTGYLLINANLINAKKVLTMIAFIWCKPN